MAFIVRFIGRWSLCLTFAVVTNHLAGREEAWAQVGLGGVAFMGAWYLMLVAEAVLDLHAIVMDRIKRLEGKGSGESL